MDIGLGRCLSLWYELDNSKVNLFYKSNQIKYLVSIYTRSDVLVILNFDCEQRFDC